MGNDPTDLSLASLELTKLEACVELMFFAAYADGHVDPSERDIFEAHLRDATRGQLRSELVRSILAQIESSLPKADTPARLTSIAARLGDDRIRRAALALAVKIACADGELTLGERAFLWEVGSAFGLSERETEAMIEGSP